jgi:hypothetical protein
MAKFLALVSYAGPIPPGFPGSPVRIPPRSGCPPTTTAPATIRCSDWT